MPTILLVTGDPAHRFLYEHGLKRHFQLAFAAPGQAYAGTVAAVVFDLDKEDALEHFAAVARLGVPMVVLTPDEGLPIPKTEHQVVLQYPVSSQQLLQALAWLGVTP
jgi:hypothetical protein